MLGRADIPVFLGERHPMGQGRGPTMLGFEGRGLLDLPYDGPESPVDATPAVSWLSQQARRQPYHLVAIGPLTNVAMALQSSAALSDNLLGLTVMGRVFNLALLPERVQEDLGRRGIRAAWSDHNTASDPDAALLCARPGVPITWITSEITFGVPLHRATLRSLPAACWLTRALVGMTDAWSDWWRRNVGPMDLEDDSGP
jgi:purine nucleosidase